MRDQRVTIQSRTVTTTNGEQTESFTTVYTYWCEASPLRASERAANNLDSYKEAYRFTFLRSSVTAAIDEGYRLVWNSNNYDVKQRPNLADRKHVDVVGELTEPNASG